MTRRHPSVLNPPLFINALTVDDGRASCQFTEGGKFYHVIDAEYRDNYKRTLRGMDTKSTLTVAWYIVQKKKSPTAPISAGCCQGSEPPIYWAGWPLTHLLLHVAGELEFVDRYGADWTSYIEENWPWGQYLVEKEEFMGVLRDLLELNSGERAIRAWNLLFNRGYPTFALRIIEALNKHNQQIPTTVRGQYIWQRFCNWFNGETTSSLDESKAFEYWFGGNCTSFKEFYGGEYATKQYGGGLLLADSLIIAEVSLPIADILIQMGEFERAKKIIEFGHQDSTVISAMLSAKDSSFVRDAAELLYARGNRSPELIAVAFANELMDLADRFLQEIKCTGKVINQLVRLKSISDEYLLRAIDACPAVKEESESMRVACSYMIQYRIKHKDVIHALKRHMVNADKQIIFEEAIQHMVDNPDNKKYVYGAVWEDIYNKAYYIPEKAIITAITAGLGVEAVSMLCNGLVEQTNAMVVAALKQYSTLEYKNQLFAKLTGVTLSDEITALAVKVGAYDYLYGQVYCNRVSVDIKTKHAIEDNKDDVPETLQKKLMALYVPPPPPPKPKPKPPPAYRYDSDSDSDSSGSGGVNYGGNGTIYDKTGNRILRIDSSGDIYNRKGDRIARIRGTNIYGGRGQLDSFNCRAKIRRTEVHDGKGQPNSFNRIARVKGNNIYNGKGETSSFNHLASVRGCKIEDRQGRRMFSYDGYIDMVVIAALLALHILST